MRSLRVRFVPVATFLVLQWCTAIVRTDLRLSTLLVSERDRLSTCHLPWIGQSLPGGGAYPKRFEFDALLNDGLSVHLRPIRPDERMAFVAFHDEEMVAVGRYDVLPECSVDDLKIAEVAFLVRDDFQGRGVGSRLLQHPTSVAVVGASRDDNSIGGRLFRNLLVRSFAGPLYPVNPSAEYVHSVKAYPTVRDIPGPVELAFITVPACGWSV